MFDAVKLSNISHIFPCYVNRINFQLVTCLTWRRQTRIGKNEWLTLWGLVVALLRSALMMMSVTPLSTATLSTCDTSTGTDTGTDTVTDTEARPRRHCDTGLSLVTSDTLLNTITLKIKLLLINTRLAYCIWLAISQQNSFWRQFYGYLANYEYEHDF